MQKPQWILLGAALLMVVGLYAATQNTLFGARAKHTAATAGTDKPHQPHTEVAGLTTDSLFYYAKKELPQAQVARLTQLENSISRGDVAEQKLHLMHQLARYWADSARAFTPLAWYPYAWYTGEAARLENSENSLSFAAHLFLNGLTSEDDARLKQWDALQAKDLFERSLKIDANNDSAKVGLGATILYGGVDAPMTGIGMIREVVAKDSTNVYAQTTLGEASLQSGQLEKAAERFKLVVKLQPLHAEAHLLLAETFERMGNKTEAVNWYKKSLSLLPAPQVKAEVQKRITQLQTK